MEESTLNNSALKELNESQEQVFFLQVIAYKRELQKVSKVKVLCQLLNNLISLLPLWHLAFNLPPMLASSYEKVTNEMI